MTSQQNDRCPELTYADHGGKIPVSEFNEPRLHLEIRGVRYVNETSSVQIIFQVSFELLRKMDISYAQFRFQALRSQDPVVHMQVEALTPAVREIVELGRVYPRKKYKSWMPKWCLAASEEEEITQCLTPYLSLEGHKALTAHSHSLWTFDNEVLDCKELLLLYPRIRLIAEFAFPPDLVKDKAPFYLVFSIDCKGAFMDRIVDIFEHAFGKDQYQYEILGQYREDLVEEHILNNKCGLRAAMGHVP